MSLASSVRDARMIDGFVSSLPSVLYRILLSSSLQSSRVLPKSKAWFSLQPPPRIPSPSPPPPIVSQPWLNNRCATCKHPGVTRQQQARLIQPPTRASRGIPSRSRPTTIMIMTVTTPSRSRGSTPAAPLPRTRPRALRSGGAYDSSAAWSRM